MKRRQFILGLSATAASGATVLGSGAFTSVTAERGISVEVVGDNSAFLRMTPVVHKIEEVDPDDAPVAEVDGVLTVDTSRPLASGVNADATTWIGTPDPTNESAWVEEDDDNIDWVGDHTYTPRAAFGVENRGTQEYELTFAYEFDGTSGSSDIEFHFYNGWAPQIGGPRDYGSFENEGSLTIEASEGDASFRLGKRIFGSIKIETGDVGDDLSGTLTITAEAP
ncbi:DUF1102 family protein [Halalkaliarchaeum sp. AArc-CO]|nr:DUF1102 family protein [Halalkaliarchaeum sp. AArc-CO]